MLEAGGLNVCLGNMLLDLPRTWMTHPLLDTICEPPVLSSNLAGFSDTLDTQLIILNL